MAIKKRKRGGLSMYKENDKSKFEEVLVCVESRCDSEDTSCSEPCELIEQAE